LEIAFADMAEDEETTINVASKKDVKDKATGVIKLKKPAPKHASPGNWQEGRFIDSKHGQFSRGYATVGVGSQLTLDL
jgi:hypothetical protein